MFWHKKKFNWPFVMFGLIALGIVISIAILLVMISDKAKDGVLRTAKGIQSAGEAMQNSSPAAVKAKYKEDLSALRKQAAGDKNWDKAFETRFFAMRVPAELLDEHLQAFWDVNGAQGDKVKILLILDELIKKAEAL
ncbi:MAG: hypothetical protein HY569_01520 [Candidatus Magasanikbacteria bacterium]|nr:hypothetical protein [Candidatus Magasanikbacteria bacterium]